MNGKKNFVVLDLLAAVCFYVAAAMEFFSDDRNTTMGIVYLCLGSVMLCFSAFQMRRSGRDDD